MSRRSRWVALSTLVATMFAACMDLEGQEVIPTWPLERGGLQWITSGIGPRKANGGSVSGTYHDGTDIAARRGTVVRSVVSGTVVICAYGDPKLGRYVVVEDDLGLRARYSHLDSTWTPRGTRVEAGDALGTVGMTGLTDGPHLDFSVQLTLDQYLQIAAWLKLHDVLDHSTIDVAYCHRRSE